MSSNPSQGSGQTESRLIRAAKALPFLGISYFAISFMWSLLPAMVERATVLMSQGVTSQIGRPGSFMPLKQFFGLEFIDGQIRGIASIFASFQFVDIIGHWQAFSFLTDAGIIYAIVLFEGARRANNLTVASFPILLGISMQLFGIGTVIGLYCFAHYIQSPSESLRARGLHFTDMSYSVLPMLVLFHYIPNYGAFLNFIDPQTRHMWEWIWQPFPIFISIAQFVLKRTFMPDTVREDQPHNTDRDLLTINYTIGTLCAVSMATWHYTFFYAPYSMTTLFTPNIPGTHTGDEHIRLFLQFDEMFCIIVCVLWMLYLFSDMKKAGMVDDSWVSIVLKAVAIFLIGGPGVTVGLGWLWRERILATKCSRTR